MDLETTLHGSQNGESHRKVVHLYRLREEDIPGFLEVLARKPHELALSVEQLTYNDRNRLIDGIEEYGEQWPDVILPMLEVLMAPDLLVHDHLCGALAVHGHRDLEHTARLLRQVAVEGYPKARHFCAEVLVSLHEECPDEVRMLLHEWAMGDELELREVVARVFGLGVLKRVKQDFMLLDLLSLDEFSAVRVQVGRAMRWYLQGQSPEAFGIIERLARDNRWETAGAAIESLGHAGPYYSRRALRLLRSLLQHRMKGIRRRAAFSLRQLARNHPRRTLTYYRNIVRERDYMDLDVLQTVLSSLRELYTQDAKASRDMLVELCKDEDETIRLRAATHLEELEALEAQARAR